MNKGVRNWLKNITDPLKFLDNILSITHPTLYDAAHQVMEKLKADPITGQYALLWPTVYSGLSPITNRTSKEHRDHFGVYPWYDQVVTFGSYQSGTFNLPEFGATFQYNPGTMMQFCGNLLLYSVNGWETGDRYCYASFFRKDVFERLGVELPRWAVPSL